MDAVSNKLKTTFVQEDPDNAQRRTVADQPVIIYTKSDAPGRSHGVTGMTFVVTAPSMPLAKYASIVEVLLSANHVVVGIYVNSLTTEGHRAKAERIPRVFAELRGDYPRVNKYGIVGHSVGGKIALLTAALYDDEHDIASVVAFDPVDQSPPEFTNPAKLTSAKKGRANLSLPAETDVTLTCTDSADFYRKKAHNARAIHTHNPATKLVMQRNAPHAVYCDEDGVLSWRALTGKGSSPDRNAAVKQEALALVKDKARRSTLPTLGGGAAGKGKVKTSIFDKAKKAVQSNIDELKELGNDAKKTGNAFAMSAKMAGVTSGM